MKNLYQTEMSISEMEDYLYENSEEDIHIEEEDKFSQLIVNEPCIYIPEINLYARTGVMCTRNTEKEHYIADFSVTVLYKKNKIGKRIYFEQDGLAATIYNYLHSIGEDKEFKDISNMKCCLAKIWDIEHQKDVVAA